MQQALWRWWLMAEGFVWRYMLYVKCIQSSRTSPKNRNAVPDVHHERLTQQSHVVNVWGRGKVVWDDCARGRSASAFKRNTGYTTRRHGRGRGRARGGSSQTLSRGGSSQISSYTASQVTAQSNQSTQEYISGIASSITGGENGSKS